MQMQEFIRGSLLGLRIHAGRCWRAYLASAALAALALLVAAGLLLLPAPHFPSGAMVAIDTGASGRAAAEKLADAGYIEHPFLFRVLVRFLGEGKGVQSGTYQFSSPVGTLPVAWNLTHGITGVASVKVTFPEGTTVRQMGALLARALPGFDEERFDAIALPAEGYLFPDTYFFPASTSEEEAMDRMRATFDSRIAAVARAIAAFGKSQRDVIIMASILEGEGKTSEERRIIAGILWKRLAIGMPLQVDAPFGYVHGKAGYAPTAADLKSDSAYNTYRYKGLPPTPINNPGVEAIRAAVTPEETDYLYYLTGTDGRTHYAETFAEHVANQKKYLK